MTGSWRHDTTTGPDDCPACLTRYPGGAATVVREAAHSSWLAGYQIGYSDGLDDEPFDPELEDDYPPAREIVNVVRDL